eukprot:COSAG05_NODE_1366_length_5062_cov_15.988762_4_plen_258_part_00
MAGSSAKSRTTLHRVARKATKRVSAASTTAACVQRPTNTIWFYDTSTKHGLQKEYAAFSNFYGGVGSKVCPPPAPNASAAAGQIAAEPPSCWPLVIDGLRWWSTEAYFQAAKFATTAPEYAEIIRRCPYMAIVFALGRQRNPFSINVHKNSAVKKFYLQAFKTYKGCGILPNWGAEEVRDAVMLKALRAKFSAVTAMKHLLLGTGDAVVVERTPRDCYWGDGLGSGKNRLGQLLMQVREELRAADAIVGECHQHKEQ